jgi:hypothetical protein
MMLTVILFAIGGAIVTRLRWYATYGAIWYCSRGTAAEPVQSSGSTPGSKYWQPRAFFCCSW